MRPIRAYSVGSRSDTAAIGKFRSGKNRLEAVQETFRIRAMSVGSKNPRKPPVHTNMPNIGLGTTSGKPMVGIGQLSSSWGGSTGRWPFAKFSSNYPHPSNQNLQYTPIYSQATSESQDSDLMELDFSRNQKNRKRSHPGPPSSLNSTPSSTVSQKLSPIPKSLLANGLQENSPVASNSDSLEVIKSPQISGGDSRTGRGHASSAPISIRGSNISRTSDPSYTYHNPVSSQTSILSQLTGTDLKKLKELDDEGAYLNMDYSKPLSQDSVSVDTSSNPATVIRPSASTTSPSTTKFCLNITSSSVISPRTEGALSKTSVSNGEPTKTVGNTASIKPEEVSQSTAVGSGSSLSASGLTRIEESPEKQEHSKPSSGAVTPQSPTKYAPLAKPEEDQQVTYASIDHLPPMCRAPGFALGNTGNAPNACGTASVISNKTGVTYAQIEFAKNAESVKPNS